MAELCDFSLEQLLALGTEAEAPPEFRDLTERQIKEVRLLQIKELMRIYNMMQNSVVGDDPKTWVFGDEAEAFFNQHVWAWHVNLLLELLQEARQEGFLARTEDQPQPAQRALPYPYNLSLDDIERGD